MYLPTDYQLQINVIYYDVNSARIFFTDGFWKSYSDQLIKDYRRETGLVLNDRKKFLARIKRALFTYYYMKLVQQKKTSDLYSTVISIFQEFSQNSLPKKVTSLDNIPIYDDEWKLEDPTDINLDDQEVTEVKTSVGSMTDILLAHESVSRREYDINKEHEDLADSFLQQFFNEKSNLERLRKDYNEGTLQQYIVESSPNSAQMSLTNVFKLTEYIYQHYGGSIGMVTIFNAISFRDIELSADIRCERRYDLWMKAYQQYDVFRSLTNYIGNDVCQMLYNRFLRHKQFEYFNGYHYVFASFLMHDLIKRSYISSSPHNFSSFISIAKDRVEMKRSEVFGHFSNNKTGHFTKYGNDTGFGINSKSSSIYSGKGLTNTDRDAKPIDKKALGYGGQTNSGFGSSTGSGFSFINKEDSDSDD